MEDSGAQQAI